MSEKEKPGYHTARDVWIFPVVLSTDKRKITVANFKAFLHEAILPATSLQRNVVAGQVAGKISHVAPSLRNASRNEKLRCELWEKCISVLLP